DLLLERRESTLVIVEAVALEALLTQEIPHLAHRPRHREELGSDSDGVFGLPSLEAINPLRQRDELLVRGANLVANLNENLGREIVGASLLRCHFSRTIARAEHAR